MASDYIRVRVTRTVSYEVHVDVRWAAIGDRTVPIVDGIDLPHGEIESAELKKALLGSVHAGSAEIVEGVRGLDEERRNADGAE